MHLQKPVEMQLSAEVTAEKSLGDPGTDVSQGQILKQSCQKWKTIGNAKNAPLRTQIRATYGVPIGLNIKYELK